MPEWASKAIIYEVNVRQYTEEGTFQAFSKHLDRLKDMGITTLWFMPIYPISKVDRKGTLGSYYSIADYTSVNPEFGTLDDFKALVQEAHKKGFTVILDWVANHTGWDNTWITEHPDWYLQDSKGNIVSPPGMGWNDVAQLNYDNNEMRQAMIDAMRFWVEEADIDGFRCDYATGVPQDFWEEAREELSEVKELYMLAEDNRNKTFLQKAFDSNYNWSLYDCLKSIAKGGRKAYGVKSLIRASASMPEGSFPLNFMDNHDKNSWDGTMIKIFGEDAIPPLTALIFTIPGAPLIYSGQEAGLNKRLQFFEKDQISWDSLPYEELITNLCKIKTDNPALSNGSAGAEAEFIETENDNILAFHRTKDNNKITVIMNLSKEEQTDPIDYSVLEGDTVLLHGTGKDEMSTAAYQFTGQEIGELSTLQPWEYYIISSASK
jgi:glycosidase